MKNLLIISTLSNYFRIHVSLHHNLEFFERAVDIFVNIGNFCIKETLKSFKTNWHSSFKVKSYYSSTFLYTKYFILSATLIIHGPPMLNISTLFVNNKSTNLVGYFISLIWHVYHWKFKYLNWTFNITTLNLTLNPVYYLYKSYCNNNAFQ